MYQQFGRVVAALRKDHLDEDLTPWTQDRLGELTGLGADIIAKIEQGKRTPDGVLAAKLADALQLTALERREFYALAVGVQQPVPRAEAGAPDQALQKLLGLLASLPLPAFLHDDYGDMIAANTVTTRFAGMSRQEMEADERFRLARFHAMRLIFDPALGYAELLGEGWTKIARSQMQLFRRMALKHRGSPRMLAIMAELRQLPEFRGMWAEAAAASAGQEGGFIEYAHPQRGTGRPMRYLGLPTLHPTPWGDLVLAVFIPLNADTTSVFAELAQQNRASPLAPWPKPADD